VNAPTPVELVQRLHESGATDEAMAAAQAALAGAPAAEQARLLIAMAQGHLLRGALNESLRSSVQACELAQSVGDRGLACDGLAGTAAVLRTAGDLHSAQSMLEQAEALALECGDTLRLARVLRVLGDVSSMLGRHQQAISALGEAESHLLAHDAREDLNIVRLSRLKARIRRLRDPATLETAAGRAEADADALALLADCEAVAAAGQSCGQARLAAMALGNHAITLSHLKRWREAIEALQALVARYRELNMQPNIGLTHVELGLAHEALGELTAAREQFTLALGVLEGSGWHSDRLAALEGIARVEEQAGDIAAAFEALKTLRAQDKRDSAEQAHRAVVQRELRIELARLTSQWARQASTDALTGLANRRALSQWLQERWARVEQGRSIVVVLLDLDHFKSINDRFGHDTGDEVLCAVARVLEAHCRISDLAVRYGGEEFLLAMSDIERADALRASERLLAAVAGHEWVRVHADLHVTTSIGLADSAEVLDAAALLTLADKRLYAAKYGGRNRVVAQG
jgi:diguanylate cyclase